MAPIIAVVGCDPEAPGGISQVIRLTMASPLASQWALQPVPTWVPGSRWRRVMVYLQSTKWLWQLALKGQLQAVHLHMAARGSFWRKWLLSLPLPMLGVRVIVQIHDGSLPAWASAQSRLTCRALRRLLECADAVLSLSRPWVQVLEPLAPKARWTVVPNPVVVPEDDDGACAEGAFERRRFRVEGADGGKVILFLGRLREEKGLKEILSAARSMKPRRPRDVWHLAGDGDVLSIQRRLAESGLTDTVFLLGWLKELQKARALAAADLLVLPSHAEGQPLAILEAMAWGIPVVGSDVGDIPQLLACGAGLVVPKGDANALVHAVEQILDHPDQAQLMGIQGRRYVQQHHSLERLSDDLDSLYRELGLTALHGLRPSTARREG